MVMNLVAYRVNNGHVIGFNTKEKKEFHWILDINPLEVDLFRQWFFPSTKSSKVMLLYFIISVLQKDALYFKDATDSFSGRSHF